VANSDVKTLQNFHVLDHKKSLSVELLSCWPFRTVLYTANGLAIVFGYCVRCDCHELCGLIVCASIMLVYCGLLGTLLCNGLCHVTMIV
jgi:hypothetical protein